MTRLRESPGSYRSSESGAAHEPHSLLLLFVRSTDAARARVAGTTD
jgi:hypothetical protein